MQVSRHYSSDLRELPRMRAFVRDVCRSEWPGREENGEVLDRLIVALQEAAANVIRHAYRMEPGRPIEVVVVLGPRELSLMVYHFGREFDPTRAPPPVLDGARVGGLGLLMIEQSVDEVHYSKDDRGRCAVHLLKRRSENVNREESMLIHVEEKGDVSVVNLLVEELDATNAEDFEKEMSAVIPAKKKVILDLDRVRFVDSRGCGVILFLLKKMNEAGGSFCLCGATKSVQTTFNLIRLHKLCPVHDSLPAALASLGVAAG